MPPRKRLRWRDLPIAIGDWQVANAYERADGRPPHATAPAAP